MEKDDRMALRSSDIGNEIENYLKAELHTLLSMYSLAQDLDRDEIRKRFPFATEKAGY